MSRDSRGSGSERRVPGARIPVTVIEEAVYWALIDEGASGILAWAVVTALNICARKQRSGVFNEPMPILARRICFTGKDIQKAVEVIQNVCEACGVPPWIEVIEGGRIVLRVYELWNPEHGGHREGAGRKAKSSGIQDAPLDYNLNNQDAHLGGAPESDTESESISREEPSKAKGSSGGLGGAREPERSGGEPLSRGSDSDSPERRAAFARWSLAVMPLFGREGSSKLPPDAPQSKADRTSAQRLFDEVIWPDDIADADGVARAEVAMQFADKARRNTEQGGKPMAYLTKLLEQIDQPERVLR